MLRTSFLPPVVVYDGRCGFCARWVRRWRARTGRRVRYLEREVPILPWLLGDRKSTRLNSQSQFHLVCRLLLEKKKKHKNHEAEEIHQQNNNHIYNNIMA